MTPFFLNFRKSVTHGMKPEKVIDALKAYLDELEEVE